MFIEHLGIPNAYSRWYNYCKSACVCSFNIYNLQRLYRQHNERHTAFDKTKKNENVYIL